MTHTQTQGADGAGTKTAVDWDSLNRLFAQMPSGPWDASRDTAGHEIRQIDTDPTNKHHWPFRLCRSIPGQRAACDDAVFDFLAGVLNAWPQISAERSEEAEIERALAMPEGELRKRFLAKGESPEQAATIGRLCFDVASLRAALTRISEQYVTHRGDMTDAGALQAIKSIADAALAAKATKASAPAPAATPDVRSLLRTARSGLATYGAGAFEGTILQIDAILAHDPAILAPAATPGVPDSVRALSEAFAETACCASCTTPMDCYQGKPCRLEPVGSGSGVVDHEFKSHPDVFWPAARGEKTFEYRRDDRGGYEVGQTVRLRCYDLTRGYHDTAPLDRRVTNILRGGEFELPMGYCILSLAPLAAQPAGQSTDDGTDRCEVCNKPLIAGQRVMQDVELGTVHAACCGPEREAYVKDVETGEPLGPNDPIPQGYVYEPGPSRPVVVCNGDPAGQSAGQAGDAGADARTVLTEACKPWEHYTGEPPDDGSPLSGVFVAGMVYTERLLAKLLNVTHYEGGDGSEDFDSDATQTLRNILTGAGLWDADENRAVKPAPDSPRTGAAETDISAAVEAAQRVFYASCGGSPFLPETQGRWEKAIRAALAARPEAPSDAGWMDISTAPKDGSEILLTDGSTVCAGFWDDAVGCRRADAGWFEECDRAALINAKNLAATHWQPMPTPPSDPAPSGQAEG